MQGTWDFPRWWASVALAGVTELMLQRCLKGVCVSVSLRYWFQVLGFSLAYPIMTILPALVKHSSCPTLEALPVLLVCSLGRRLNTWRCPWHLSQLFQEWKATGWKDLGRWGILLATGEGILRLTQPGRSDLIFLYFSLATLISVRLTSPVCENNLKCLHICKLIMK